jgi:thiamine transport system substrate-binding protein
MLKKMGLLIALGCLCLGLIPALAQGERVTLIAHDSFSVSEEVLAAFEAETGMEVEIVLAGDAGTMVNQAILSRNNPQGDVLFGVDNTFLGRALENDLFEPYQSPLLEDVPAEFILDPDYRVTPIDYGDVCLNYDVAYFEDNDLPLPTHLRDLTDPQYKGLLVVENPAISSPGLAFLLVTVAAFGEDGEYTYLDFWEDLVANDVLVVNDWTSAYFGAFTVGGGGDRPLVVSYASSPPAEIIFAEEPLDAAPTGSIVTEGTCFRQIEFAGILSGTENREAAEKLIDYMLSEAFQEDMPLQMFVFPVNPQADLPPEFVEYAQLAEEPVTLSPEDIEAKRDEWIQAWTKTVLR